ncbi:FAD dependent oxidoreductase [Arthrobacter sp. OV608]|nr:FAD dependent oxidoreductase [Arthrobacter sp. OV608]
MTSIWLDGRDAFASDPFEPGSSYDTVVAGAGLTGLVTALLLARSGQNVLVLEARFPGAVTTGNTTAKVTLLQGTFLSQLSRQYSQKQVQAYVDGNREGQAWLLRYLDEQNVPYQIRDAYTYAASAQGTEKLREEVSAATTAGLDMEYVRDAGLPFPVHGAIRLADQAQIHPVDVLDALVADIRGRGGSVVGGVRLQDVTGGRPATVHTDHGTVTANEVVLATGFPCWTAGCTSPSSSPAAPTRQQCSCRRTRRRPRECTSRWNSQPTRCGTTRGTAAGCCWWAGTGTT